MAHALSYGTGGGYGLGYYGGLPFTPVFFHHTLWRIPPYYRNTCELIAFLGGTGYTNAYFKIRNLCGDWIALKNQSLLNNGVQSRLDNVDFYREEDGFYLVVENAGDPIYYGANEVITDSEEFVRTCSFKFTKCSVLKSLIDLSEIAAVNIHLLRVVTRLPYITQWVSLPMSFINGVWKLVINNTIVDPGSLNGFYYEIIDVNSNILLVGNESINGINDLIRCSALMDDSNLLNYVSYPYISYISGQNLVVGSFDSFDLVFTFTPIVSTDVSDITKWILHPQTDLAIYKAGTGSLPNPLSYINPTWEYSYEYLGTPPIQYDTKLISLVTKGGTSLFSIGGESFCIDRIHAELLAQPVGTVEGRLVDRGTYRQGYLNIPSDPPYETNVSRKIKENSIGILGFKESELATLKVNEVNIPRTDRTKLKFSILNKGQVLPYQYKDFGDEVKAHTLYPGVFQSIQINNGQRKELEHNLNKQHILINIYRDITGGFNYLHDGSFISSYMGTSILYWDTFQPMPQSSLDWCLRQFVSGYQAVLTTGSELLFSFPGNMYGFFVVGAAMLHRQIDCTISTEVNFYFTGTFNVTNLNSMSLGFSVSSTSTLYSTNDTLVQFEVSFGSYGVLQSYLSIGNLNVFLPSIAKIVTGGVGLVPYNSSTVVRLQITTSNIKVYVDSIEILSVSASTILSSLGLNLENDILHNLKLAYLNGTGQNLDLSYGSFKFDNINIIGNGPDSRIDSTNLLQVEANEVNKIAITNPLPTQTFVVRIA